MTLYANTEVVRPQGVTAASVPTPDPDHARLIEDQNSVKSGGTVTYNGPINVVWVLNTSGSCVRSFFDDFYGTYHFTPNPIEVGTITGEKHVQLAVWNAYFSAHDLNGTDVPGDPGTHVDIVTPTTFKALESRIVDVVFGAEGAPVIDTDIVFQFDNATPTVHATGLRVVLFRLPPNWRASLKDRVEFKTDIFMSWNGREQRRALRNTPRRSVQFTVTETGTDLHYLTRNLSRRQDTTFVVPDYVRWVLLTADAPGTDTELHVSSIEDWMMEKQLVVLAHDEDMASTTIESVDATTNTITLSSPTGTSFPEGSRVLLGVPARMRKKQSVKHLTHSVVEASVAFDVDPGALKWPDVSWADEYDGRKLLMEPPNWVGNMTEDYQSLRDTVDFGFGQVSVSRRADFSVRTIKAKWTGMDKDKVKRLWDFFIYHRGQAKAFWAPSWSEDFVPMKGLTQGQLLIRVRGTDFQRDYLGSPIHKAVRVLLRDGTSLLRKVTDILIVTDNDGTDTTIIVDNPWDNDVPLDDIVCVEWLYLCRFGSDILDLDWPLDKAAHLAFTITALKVE